MIHVQDLKVDFGSHSLFGGLSFHVKAGEKVAVKGESGSGKSTLLHTLLGFIPQFEGHIEIDGLALNPSNIHEIRRRTSWVPQDLRFTVFPTVREMFYAPFRFKNNRHLMPRPEEMERIFHAFEISEDLLDRQIKEISGGQKQRLILAAAVLLRKPVLLLDEPTSALNVEIKNKITDYLLGLEGITLMAATHDEYFISKADRIINL
ncbi:MAG: ABC transporter ATP-binding protein [Chlorobi bacterium]|nr:ABC transporter ATP-binding protein [Chlorobiota bacterium]